MWGADPALRAMKRRRIMNFQKLQKALRLAAHFPCILIATTNSDGFPFVAPGGRLNLTANGLLEIPSWFSIKAMGNIHDNKRVSVVLFDPEQNYGFQILGKVVEINELSAYDPSVQCLTTFIEWSILFQADVLLDFRLDMTPADPLIGPYHLLTSDIVPTEETSQ
jgi:hypothetical protein